jgi:chemotaxis protein MotB
MSNQGFFEKVVRPKVISSKNAQPWLLSYSDLVTNLMAIFVLLFSMSTLDAAKFDTVSSEVTRRETDNLAALKRKIDEQVVANGLSAAVRTELGFEGLRVIFQGSSMFLSASSKPVPEHLAKVEPILTLLGSTDPIYRVTLEGHTDDVPLRKSSRYVDNWALSSARGVSLLGVLSDRGIAVDRMSVGGYAATRPVVPLGGLSGDELKSARAMNRRVAIRIYQ